jgi:hypothetical protein
MSGLVDARIDALEVTRQTQAFALVVIILPPFLNYTQDAVLEKATMSAASDTVARRKIEGHIFLKMKKHVSNFHGL